MFQVRRRLKSIAVSLRRRQDWRQNRRLAMRMSSIWKIRDTNILVINWNSSPLSLALNLFFRTCVSGASSSKGYSSCASSSSGLKTKKMMQRMDDDDDVFEIEDSRHKHYGYGNKLKQFTSIPCISFNISDMFKLRRRLDWRQKRWLAMRIPSGRKVRDPNIWVIYFNSSPIPCISYNISDMFQVCRRRISTNSCFPQRRITTIFLDLLSNKDLANTLVRKYIYIFSFSENKL